MLMRLLALAIVIFFASQLQGQRCTIPGQTPVTAFPVCGNAVFNQRSVSECTNGEIPVPGCARGVNNYADKNPYWYKFYCYSGGTLGFLIKPNNGGDDYDWQLFDITNHHPDDVYTDASLVVTANWTGNPVGNTGASADGVPYLVCGTINRERRPAFTAMPTLIEGHQYLLLISHFTNSQSGYSLSFGGGTAVITDPDPPKPDRAWAGCGGVTVTVKLDKKLICTSLAADGSDFSMVPMPAGVKILSASSSRCNGNFDMDTVQLQLSTGLPPGDYQVLFKRGTDGNTLTDECGREVAEGSVIPFKVLPVPYTPMDSLMPVVCAPKYVDLFFSKPMWCPSIEPGGSDFRITGTTPVRILKAYGNCVNKLSTTIRIEFDAPILLEGNYIITLVEGSDGNTIEDECRQETPAGATLRFSTKDTVNADFNYSIQWGCKEDIVHFTQHGKNKISSWNWNFNGEGSSTAQNPVFGFKLFGDKKIHLTVSNGFCTAGKDTLIQLDNYIYAAFSVPDFVCPDDVAVFKNQSAGKIVSWEWNFDNGYMSTSKDPPPQKYPPVTIGRNKYYNVQLKVTDKLGCTDTRTKRLQVVYSCSVAVPNAFTPNNDGNNDYLYPLNAWKATNVDFSVFNRYGQLIFHTTDWTRKWDGTFKGAPQPTGNYVWMLQYTDPESGIKVVKKGSTILIR
ncbi:T9SS type B sorting domain-containing protein [Pseudoflavitalea sp. G-6-1-2]|uniref:T9SS type B sorting domain-containing protein n=1 Tax=Pseudoflavitalea sp. G-6-1-2 TaxID=2728841 RepID=UPI001469F05B|nr:gliding motility-associated C-terminal domain-containing protein [Pseudoflavitalea sp. G-6-1-2]NML23493.1 T9SS type B sorting domain-containing protein [Pseudoflavitalea sp. G-6-1-2]